MGTGGGPRLRCRPCVQPPRPAARRSQTSERQRAPVWSGRAGGSGTSVRGGATWRRRRRRRWRTSGRSWTPACGECGDRRRPFAKHAICACGRPPNTEWAESPRILCPSAPNAHRSIRSSFASATGSNQPTGHVAIIDTTTSGNGPNHLSLLLPHRSIRSSFASATGSNQPIGPAGSSGRGPTDPDPAAPAAAGTAAAASVRFQ